MYGSLQTLLGKGEDFLSNTFRQASQKIRDSGAFSLSDDEKKTYIDSLTKFAKENVFNITNPQAVKSSLIKKAVTPFINRAVDTFNMPEEQRTNLYREYLANQLQKDYLAQKEPESVTRVRKFTDNLPNVVENRYQESTKNLSPALKLLLTPTHLTSKIMSHVPGVAVGMVSRSPEENARIEQIKATGTTQEKASLMKELQMEQASTLAFGATSAPYERGLTKEVARSIFKVGPNATEAEINSAFKNLMLSEAPRTVQDIATASKSNAAKVLNNAREILLNETKNIGTNINKLLSGSTSVSAPERLDINNLVDTAIKESTNQVNAIDRLGAVVDKAVQANTPNQLQQLKTLRASISRNMFNVVGASGTGNYKQDYAVFQMARQNPETSKLVDNMEAQILRIDDSVKELSINIPKKPTLTTPVIDRTQLTGRQLSMTNEQLLHPERIVSNEDLGIAEREYRMNKPTKQNDYQKRAVMVTDFEKHLESMDIPPNKKVGILDYFRTPENVLNKIGMGDQAKVLRTAYDTYKTDLRNEQLQILEWQKQVPDKNSNKTIFNYLDGKITAESLSEKEIKVAMDIKFHLKEWARKLGLPTDSQISNYITHLFEKGQVQKEFDPELARLIDTKVPGSVWNPFKQKRMDKPEYIQDTWRALDAYFKRGTRDVNMTPALAQLKKSSQDLDRASWKYIKSYADRINLRPTEIDDLLDNFIKSTPIGYKATERPTSYLTKKWRNMIYKGALGINFGSAMKNLTQGVNTYTVLGTKYTSIGYTKLMANIATKNLDELYRYNILDDSIIQDRELASVKKALSKIDDGLFTMFNTAELINRGSAFYGAKSKALSGGKTEAEAIAYAKKIVAQTQFLFNQIDTPLILSSDLAKTLGQFQSFNIKQVEFLAGLVKDKNFGGLLRYIIGSLVVAGTVGKVFGLDVTNFIPFYGGRFSSPASEALGVITGSMSQSEQAKAEAKNSLQRLLPLMVPGGVQIKKSLQGSISEGRGYTATKTGNVRYPVSQDPMTAVRMLLFGENSIPEAREYYSKDRSPLGKDQTEFFKHYGKDYYNSAMRERLQK